MIFSDLLEAAKKSLIEVETILDEIVEEWNEPHMQNQPLTKELHYLLIQIGNVAQSARDLKRHMADTCY